MLDGSQAAIPVRHSQPGGDAEGIVLVARATSTREAKAPEGRINFRDRRAAGRHFPSIEGPEVHARAQPLAQEPQPGDARVGGRGRSTL